MQRRKSEVGTNRQWLTLPATAVRSRVQNLDPSDKRLQRVRHRDPTVYGLKVKHLTDMPAFEFYVVRF